MNEISSGSKEINIKHLLEKYGLENHPIIGGVISGKQLGKVFVDNRLYTKFAVVYAIHEMIYLIGEEPYLNIEDWFLVQILPIACEYREEDINIETYPVKTKLDIQKLFPNLPIKQGKRVSFVFSKEIYSNNRKEIVVPDRYSIERIKMETFYKDTDALMKHEILKFWHSVESFVMEGLGVAAFYENKLIGTCISVYQHNEVSEIGINTYDTSHRGKGIATAMATLFIEECLKSNITPRWTTELFRKDSISIARKLGFINEEIYPSYYFFLHEVKKPN
ncbi:GNAT family N-acetyltransferase [Sutcliffiella halmapala]|uniref:GNAT family N-acetyltransferase n=1 Tax=Sutcliffiella halmapala TaxID=79882 RepID=UPI0009953B69|nr:GNAT family N-acetyltransferase [Sutcliffiella halmapala]